MMVVSTVFWILMIVHAATKPVENKVIWIVIMILTGIIGALVYYFAVKRKFNKPSVPPTSTPPIEEPPTGGANMNQ